MTFRIGPRTNQIIAYSILLLMTLITVIVLFFIIGYVFKNGIGQLSLEFLTDKTREMGKEGGIFPSILGTFFVTIFAVVIATPLGVGSAVYLFCYHIESGLEYYIRWFNPCRDDYPDNYQNNRRGDQSSATLIS